MSGCNLGAAPSGQNNRLPEPFLADGHHILEMEAKTEGDLCKPVSVGQTGGCGGRGSGQTASGATGSLGGLLTSEGLLAQGAWLLICCNEPGMSIQRE